MKFDRKTHITERQLSDLSGLTLDALRVRSKTDPKFPDVLFVNNEREIVYDKAKALTWLSWLPSQDDTPLITAQPATPVPLAKQGEYKPGRSMIRNLERTEKLYPHSLVTPKGIGNRANLGGHYDARWWRDGF